MHQQHVNNLFRQLHPHAQREGSKCIQSAMASLQSPATQQAAQQAAQKLLAQLTPVIVSVARGLVGR
ncbi:MAG: hypothetical protein WBA07_35030 [Rivularia sp. (in: cyanobacteria)]